MPDVRLVNVTKRYGRVIAVEGLNLHVRDGEYFVLLGPSGCGKTTTLRIIAGLTKPDEGRVYIDGRDVSGIPPEDRNIGLVFQHFEIFPFMTVYENVAYSLMIQGLDEEEIERRVYQALEVAGLNEVADRYPEELGAPELQRCSIARALAKGSRLLLLDEPLGSLDPETRERFRFTLRSLVKGRGLTAIHVTHDQEEAMAIADRIAVFRRGRVLQVGTPMELYERPASIFVANFVGETNFLEGVIERSGERSLVRLRGDLLIEAGGSNLRAGSRVVIGVRRENILLEEGKAEGLNALPGRVIRAAFLGKIIRYRVELDNGDLVEVKQPTRLGRFFGEGERVYLIFPAEKVLVYPYPEDLRYELALR
ncbi:ABC transporter ATP-binding protein [Candidatus Bathyarchaeota archaeon]|nr:MAG: ABC transporter ATP-binding protein [Candidatus Bathyarchaeota archaeon]